MKVNLVLFICILIVSVKASMNDLIKKYTEAENLIEEKYDNPVIKKYSIEKLNKILSNNSFTDNQKLEEIVKFIKELNPKYQDDTSYDVNSELTKSILIINGERGTGTGFLTSFKGKKVAITNRHVVDKEYNFSILDFKNNKIEYSQVAIAMPYYESDLVMFLLKDQEKEDYNLLKLSDMSLTNVMIGAEIMNYGNNQGSGVLSKEKGTILAIGPKWVETNLKNVKGSSGSPIILKKSNEVVAVETLAIKEKLNWITKGTRYYEKRNFGLRVDSIKNFLFI